MHLGVILWKEVSRRMEDCSEKIRMEKPPRDDLLVERKGRRFIYITVAVGDVRPQHCWLVAGPRMVGPCQLCGQAVE